MQLKAIEICTGSNFEIRERFWIDKLNVSFPYGLNDLLSKKGVVDVYNHVMENNSNNTTIYEQLFEKIPSRRAKRGGRKVNGNTPRDILDSFDASTFMINLMYADINERKSFILHVRNKVMHMTNDCTKLLFIHLAEAIKDNNDYLKIYSSCRFTGYLPYLVKDICLAKLK